MRTIKSLLAVLSLSLFTFSCGDRNNPEPEQAGKGGSTTLKVTPMHHDKNIDSCTVYIKYNAQDKPSNYDEEVKCVMESGKPVATFTGLKKGKYYVYGSGWDENIEQAVVGGIPYTISQDGVVEINVPVTEGH